MQLEDAACHLGQLFEEFQANGEVDMELDMQADGPGHGDVHVDQDMPEPDITDGLDSSLDFAGICTELHPTTQHDRPQAHPNAFSKGCSEPTHASVSMLPLSLRLDTANTDRVPSIPPPGDTKSNRHDVQHQPWADLPSSSHLANPAQHPAVTCTASTVSGSAPELSPQPAPRHAPSHAGAASSPALDETAAALAAELQGLQSHAKGLAMAVPCQVLGPFHGMQAQQVLAPASDGNKQVHASPAAFPAGAAVQPQDRVAHQPAQLAAPLQIHRQYQPPAAGHDSQPNTMRPGVPSMQPAVQQVQHTHSTLLSHAADPGFAQAATCSTQHETNMVHMPWAAAHQLPGTATALLPSLSQQHIPNTASSQLHSQV